MGDPARFERFAEFIARNVTDRRARIADVAAGKGALTFALLRHGFSHVVPFEPEPRRGGQVTRLGMRVECFEPSFARDFDVLVGMHPDEATDCILCAAAEHGTLAIVRPCCPKPSAWPYAGARRWDTSSFDAWETHLVQASTERGLSVWETSLPIRGRNHVLVAGRAA